MSGIVPRAGAVPLPDLLLERVVKQFGPVTAVNGFSLAVEHGELVSLLGPSGCGKTTTLSLIAGFEPVSEGAISIHGARIETLPPERRNTGMVFQNYALFPHMTAAENVAFGLRARRMGRAAITEKVARVLSLVRMDGMAERRPSALSGGQQQRIALARALVIEPVVLLLDEAFGALDRQLREHMQIELRALQRALGITTIFVTHDQEEALSISDRVVVMSNGAIEQAAAPTELYERPATRFVAGFIGKSNLFAARVAACDDATLALDTGFGRISAARPRERLLPGAEIEVMLRPEKLRLELAPAEGAPTARVVETAYLGATAHIHLELFGGLRALASDSEASVGGRLKFRPGETVGLQFDPRDLTLFVDGRRCN
ncbi:MAG: ABC transporter ATP-binding protein [Alphaproteobacteria bacterium]